MLHFGQSQAMRIDHGTVPCRHVPDRPCLFILNMLVGSMLCFDCALECQELNSRHNKCHAPLVAIVFFAEGQAAPHQESCTKDKLRAFFSGVVEGQGLLLWGWGQCGLLLCGDEVSQSSPDVWCHRFAARMKLQ